MTYDSTIGAELQFIFSRKSKFNHYINAGFNADLGIDGANLFTFNAGIGTSYNLFSMWKKPFSVSLNAGGLYMHEIFKNQVIGNVIENQFSNFSFFGKLGTAYPITKKLQLQLNVMQYGTKGTSLGTSILFSF
ncbi:protein of unknown function [Tenacibaculum sp. 190524A02b]|uniref:hypothetical protein n=1 Tax=Tenacibaculum vairaonense TaxID=3137860 RepID=UPI0032B0F619